MKSPSNFITGDGSDEGPPRKKQKRNNMQVEKLDVSWNFNQLPNEIITKIFSYFTMQELARHVLLVCRLWYQLGSHVSLNRELIFDYLPRNVGAIDHLAYKISNVWQLHSIIMLVHRCNLPKCSGNKLINAAIAGGHSLQEFIAPTVGMKRNSLAKLMKSCPKLQVLHIDYESDRLLDSADVEQIKSMQKFKNNGKYCLTLDALNTLTNNTSHRLEEISFGDKIPLEHISIVIDRVSPRLKELNFTNGSEIIDHSFLYDLSRCSELTALFLHGKSFYGNLNNLAVLKHLKTLYLSFGDYSSLSDSNPYAELLTKAEFVGLEELLLHNVKKHPSGPDLHDVICDKFRNLHGAMLLNTVICL